ncbi:helix-turn-helix domain-containing protein [Tsuneonella sp. HG249]
MIAVAIGPAMDAAINDTSSPPRTLGDRIYQARQGAGMSLNDLARQVGVSKVTVWSWENDRSRPRSDKLETIARSLGISPSVLHFEKPARRSDVTYVVADCRRRIAKAAGISEHDVAIVVSYGRPVDPERPPSVTDATERFAPSLSAVAGFPRSG